MPRALPWSAVACALSLLTVGIAAAQEPAATPSAPAAAPGEAQPGRDITVVLPEANQLPVIQLAFPAVPNLSSLPGPAANAGRELDRTLRSDLDRSGIFEILGPDDLAVLTLSGDLERDADQYRSLGAAMLLQSEVKLEADKVVLEGRLIDLASRQTIVGKRYRGTYDLARRIAHTFADEIVLFLTSRRGIALTSLAFVSDRDGSKEIYLMDYDGHDQRRVTGHKSISMSPAWSGSGDTISYVSFFGGGPALYLADVATGRKTPLVTEGSLNASPAFSPDGRQVAFARALGANIEIFVCNRDGSGVRRLSNSPGIDTNPAWSPSGREIAFTSSRGTGRPQIYVTDADGANVRRITFTGDYNDGAAWSPDGTRIAYSSRQESGAFGVSITNLVDLATKLLLSGGGSHEHPTFSPDGHRIAFASTRSGKTQIFVMNDDGAALRPLTADGNNYSPDWSGYTP